MSARALGLCSILLLATIIMGCSAVALRPEANRIEIAQSAAQACLFIGDVEGQQGNPLIQAFTHEEDLRLGERNALLNEALEKGADTIVLTNSRTSGLTGDDPSAITEHQTSAGIYDEGGGRLLGRAYQCKPR